ncbi:cytochrome P450 [Mycena pura]|uniref:Cytochrome P450 n=1 Tax=Mycena pura TaxID=153505 RepID=A0AAD6V0H3_9AGAR|nr:cytochrome P450 [Mycena pura]
MSYTVVFATVIAALALFWSTRRRGTISKIAGPPSPSWIFGDFHFVLSRMSALMIVFLGNMLQLLIPPQYGDNEFKWNKVYGSVYRIKECFGKDRLIVSDPIPMQYVINDPSFVPSPLLQAIYHWIFGANSMVARHGTIKNLKPAVLLIVFCTGDEHRKLRASLNPAFTAAAVRQYQPGFLKVAQTITEQLNQSDALSIDMCPILSAATLKAICEVVFGCPTEDMGADFVNHNTQILHISSSQSTGQVLGGAICALLPQWFLHRAIYLPTKTFRACRTQLYLANREGRRIVREKTEAARLGLETDGDLYGVLLNSNRSDTKSIQEEDIVGQTSIITIAGQDTTANTLAFGLIELAKNPQFQDSLRVEIHAAFGTDRENIPYDNMPLLNAFIKESLRLYPVEALSDRTASEDVAIPLSNSITTTAGERLNQIHVRKGEVVTLAIASYQRMESRWGVDADKFRPSRWLDETVYQGEAVGPYANLFLGGPRTCLGVFEMQVFLCELVGNFSFSLPADHSARVIFANTLMPTNSQGEKWCKVSFSERLTPQAWY